MINQNVNLSRKFLVENAQKSLHITK